jgi:PAS domain S-box-containing protein
MESSMSGKKVQILLVEDEAGHASLARRAFADYSGELHLTTAESLRRARELLVSTEFDLVITDLHLPDGLGTDLLLGKGAEGPYPVVVMTSCGSEEIATETMKAGALDYMVKTNELLMALPHVAERTLREWKQRIEHRKTAEELRQSEARYRNMVENINDVIYEMDAEGRFTYVSPVGEQLFGYPATEVLGRHFSEFVYPDDMPQLMARYRATMEGNPEPKEFRVLDKKGNIRYVRASSRPLYREGQLVGLTGLMTDITERKETEAAMLQSSRLIALGELAAAAVHELSQPLSAISLSSGMLKRAIAPDRELDRENLNRDIEMIAEQVKRMKQLVKHLRTFSRDHTQEPDEPVQINQVVQMALQVAGAQLESRAVDLHLDLADDISPVQGNPYRLEQVIINLVNNARDALEEKEKQLNEKGLVNGGKSLWVRTLARAEGVVIEIEDNGIGIDADHCSRLFEAFFTTKTRETGTGLGLSISSSIVQKYGGTIECESRAGKGALFRVIIPSAEADGGKQVGGQ